MYYLELGAWDGTHIQYALFSLLKRNEDDQTCATSTPMAEQNFGDFTLYFLAFNHSGRELTDEEKKSSMFAREGAYHPTYLQLNQIH